jgi:hypothetical protein
MRHLAFRLEDIVYHFDFFMGFYFARLGIAILAITGAAAWLFRSKKGFMVVAACLAIVGGAYGLCQWTHLQHRLYCYGTYGQFHVPALHKSNPAPAAPPKHMAAS